MLTVLLILATFGQDVPRPVPKPAIRLPELSVPTPTPVSPDAVQVLKAGELFIVDSDQECFIRQAPPGVLKIKPMVGPRSFYAVFAGGTGEPEERDYAGKFLYVLTAAKTARCELFVIPKGVDADNKILQRTIDALVGPRPPPDPLPPDPEPPKPPEPAPLTGLAKQAFEWASACTSPTRAKDAAALAKNFRTVASAQAAGVYVNLATMSNELRVLNQTAIETDDAWRVAFFVPLKGELDKSVKTLADYGAACKAVAQGLENVK